MKTIPPSLRPWLLILIIFLLAIGSAALSPASPLQQGVLPAAALAAPTPKPQLPVDEVSTDLIVILGGALLLIVLTPILLHVREWARLGRDDGRAGVDGDEE
jgi:hypothetical protein